MPKIIWLFMIAVLAPSMSRAAPPAERRPAAAGATSMLGDRSKSLDFDSDVIEGMNKNPLDALTQMNRKDDKQQGHLYRRKSHFKREIHQTVQEMGYTQ